jgi:hypothetical protein
MTGEEGGSAMTGEEELGAGGSVTTGSRLLLLVLEPSPPPDPGLETGGGGGGSEGTGYRGGVQLPWGWIEAAARASAHRGWWGDVIRRGRRESPGRGGRRRW